MTQTQLTDEPVFHTLTATEADRVAVLPRTPTCVISSQLWPGDRHDDGMIVVSIPLADWAAGQHAGQARSRAAY